MNTITVVGNLTRDPELRYTPGGQAVVRFSVAVNRSYTNRKGETVTSTDFLTVNAWRSLAEHVATSLRSGGRVLITGRLQTRSWETEDGQKRSAVEIEAEEVAASLRFATVAITKPKASEDPDASGGLDGEDAEAEASQA